MSQKSPFITLVMKFWLAWSEIQELSCELTNDDQMMRSFSLSQEEIDTMMHMDMLSCKQKLKVWDFKVVLGKMKTNVNLSILNPSTESKLTQCRKKEANSILVFLNPTRGSGQILPALKKNCIFWYIIVIQLTRKILVIQMPPILFQGLKMA